MPSSPSNHHVLPLMSAPPPPTDQEAIDRLVSAEPHYSTSSADMPPPQTVMFAPPPPATFTVTQLLAYPLQSPSAPSGVTAKAFTAKVKRPTHKSSDTSDKYQSIKITTLREVPNILVGSFRDKITAMDSIKFDHPIALRWDASPMMSEGSVTGYLDAQVLIAAWQAVLQMLPQERNYDVQMVKQTAIEVIFLPGMALQTLMIILFNLERGAGSNILYTHRGQVYKHRGSGA